MKYIMIGDAASEGGEIWFQGWGLYFLQINKFLPCLNIIAHSS